MSFKHAFRLFLLFQFFTVINDDSEPKVLQESYQTKLPIFGGLFRFGAKLGSSQEYGKGYDGVLKALRGA